MPQVPDSFVPSATISPFGISQLSAEPVQPMRNAAPAQEQQAGADVQKLGAETFDIGSRIQSQLDSAMAKQAETGFLNKVLDITNGDGTDKNPGYLNTRGQAAIDGYKDATARIAQAKQDSAAGLADDFQKSMFNRVASQHLVNFGRQMADHSFQQGQQFYTEASVNRASSYATLAGGAGTTYGQVDGDGNPAGDFLKYTKIAEQNTLDAVQRAKGAPPLSATAAAALVNLHTQIGISALTQMMDAPEGSRPSPQKLQAIFDDMKDPNGGFSVKQQQADGSIVSVPGLDDKAVETLSKMVKSYSDSEMVPAAARQALSDAARKGLGQPTSSTGTPDYSATPIKGATVTAGPYIPNDPGKKTTGGVTIAVPTGSNIQAPADGKVTQVGRNADGNFSMQLEHKDGSLTSFTGLAAANVKVGDQVQGGETVATTGSADGKNASVLWSLTNAKGVNVDPTKAGLPAVDLSKITDEKVLDSALETMRTQITDPKLQYQTGQEMIRTVSENQRQQNAGDTQLFKQASEAFYKGGMNWRSIPGSLFAQLPAERQQQFKDAQTEEVLKNYHQGQAFKEMGETDAVANFYMHPELLTQANVDAARPQLANSTYLQLTQRANALENKPEKVMEATVEADRLKYLADQAGIPKVYAKEDENGKRDYASLLVRVQQEIDQAQQQKQGKLTQTEKDAIMQRNVQQHVITHLRSAWNPMSWGLGKPTWGSNVRGYQMPEGATGTAMGDDGKLHYTDGKNNDLGVAPE